MTLTRFVGIAIALAILIIVGLTSCSDDSVTVAPTDNVTTTTSAVMTYFPLDEGYTSIYSIKGTDGISRTVTFRVGDEISTLDGTVIEWISNDPKTGLDTGFFQVTSTAIYYRENITSAPEKILQLPLSPGQTWDRFEDSDVKITTDFKSFDDVLIEGAKTDYVLDTAVISIYATYKNLPIIGEAIMTVEEAGPLQLTNGDYYTAAYRISTETAGVLTNYYWFVPGVGLVKYVTGATDDNPANGDVVGELMEYGFQPQ